MLDDRLGFAKNKIVHDFGSLIIVKLSRLICVILSSCSSSYIIPNLFPLGRFVIEWLFIL